MFGFKSLLATAGLVTLGLFATSERADAGTLGTADIGVAAFIAGTYDAATGDVEGIGTLEITYDFSLPVGPALYTGDAFGGISVEIFDALGASVETADIPFGIPLEPTTFSLGGATVTPEFAAIVALLSGLAPTGPLDLGFIGFGSVTGTYSLTVDPMSTASLLTDPITGIGGFLLEFDFADDGGGDLATIVADLAPESGSLVAGLFAGITIHADPVPVPAGAALLPIGLAGFALLRRRRRKAD